MTLTTAVPLARYRAIEGALASGFATAELYHLAGHDQGLMPRGEVIYQRGEILHVGHEFRGEVDERIDCGQSLVGRDLKIVAESAVVAVHCPLEAVRVRF